MGQIGGKKTKKNNVLLHKVDFFVLNFPNIYCFCEMLDNLTVELTYHKPKRLGNTSLIILKLLYIIGLSVLCITFILKVTGLTIAVR